MPLNELPKKHKNSMRFFPFLPIGLDFGPLASYLYRYAVLKQNISDVLFWDSKRRILQQKKPPFSVTFFNCGSLILLFPPSYNV